MPLRTFEDKKRNAIRINAQELDQALAREQELEAQPVQQEEEEFQEHVIDNDMDTLQAQAAVQAGVQAVQDPVPLQEEPSPLMMKEYKGKEERKIASEEKAQRTRRRWHQQYGQGNEAIVTGDARRHLKGRELMGVHILDQAIKVIDDAVRIKNKKLDSKYDTPDPLGYVWRTNCKKYQKTPLKSPSKSVLKKADEDVENLADNYYMALFVEKRSPFPRSSKNTRITTTCVKWGMWVR